MSKRWLIWTFGLSIAAIIGSVVTILLTKGQLKPLSVKVYFDGGYVVDFSKPDTVPISVLTNAQYPMKFRVDTPAISAPIDLKGYTLRLLPDGSAPPKSKPGIPPEDPSKTGCDVSDQLAGNVNNRFFIPHLAEVASRMSTTVKAAPTFDSTVEITGGGSLSVAQLGGCVEFHDASDNPIADWPKRSMVSGIGGILYEWSNFADHKVVLERTPLGGGAPLLTDALPNAGNQIVIRISSFLADSGTAGAPHDIAHFKKHFDDAFSSIDEAKRIRLHWNGPYIVSPGIDCPFGTP